MSAVKEVAEPEALWSRVVWALARLILLGSGLVALLALLPDTPWWMTLFDPFRLHIGLGLAFGATLAFLCKRWVPTLIAVTLAAAHMLTLGTKGEGPIHPSAGARQIKVMGFNVLGGNTRFDDIKAYVDAEQPDIIVLLEVRPDLAAHLRGWRDYPSQLIEARPGNFGVALLARWPLTPTEVRTFGRHFPSVVGATDLDGRPLIVIGTHPPPPVSNIDAQTRSRQLSDIAEFISEEAPRFLGPLYPEGVQPHVIVVGDFNATPWSSAVQPLIRLGGLRDTRRGFGYHATWPTYLGPVGIPIDNAFISGDLGVVSRKVGPDLGSDHRPVVVTVTPLPP